MRGKSVWARDFMGDFHSLVVWDVGKKAIYVAEKTQFDRLEKGLKAPSPIGYPKEDIFYENPNQTKV